MGAGSWTREEGPCYPVGSAPPETVKISLCPPTQSSDQDLATEAHISTHKPSSSARIFLHLSPRPPTQDSYLIFSGILVSQSSSGTAPPKRSFPSPLPELVEPRNSLLLHSTHFREEERWADSRHWISM